MAHAAALPPATGPTGWPGPGPIDLAVHDLPHADAPTEWWYFHAHLRTEDGRELAAFASFFRVAVRLDEARRPVFAHSLVRAVSDLATRRYFAESRIDRDAPRLGLEKLDRGEGTRDPRLRRAIREVVERNQVPLPDRMFDAEVEVAVDRLALDFGSARVEKTAPGRFQLLLAAGDRTPGAVLTFVAEKPAIRHGDNGRVTGVDGREMFYYFVPRCRVTGHVLLDGAAVSVTGSGWYDHEIGRSGETEEPQPIPVTQAAAWTWVAAQLDDGSELCAYEMVRTDTGAPLGKRALLVDPRGGREEILDFHFTPTREWRSTRTFNDYPTAWRLELPDAGLELDVIASFEDQELITLISKPAFWEGRCAVVGRRHGQPVSGRAFVERSGFATVDSLEEFFSAVGDEVRKSVRALVPKPVPYEHARDLIASPERDHYMDGVSLDTLSKALADPVREITDRGGKAWRSYAALACCDMVGGDSRRYVQWLAMPEILHVGSLIVDDVEDHSELRRGGPSCHKLYGEAIAINAGTACYFLGHNLLKGAELTDKDKLRVYSLYFEALRAGHAGQALDLYGLAEPLALAAESGDGETLERRVLAIHRLKTAAPAASLARMGAIAGRGSEEQIEALGTYFESLGCAFQIMDDVLNLRGFRGTLKTRGEDLSRGLVTMPVAKAMSRLSPSARKRLAEALAAKPRERAVIDDLIAELETCGAISACVAQAGEMVEKAWQRLDPLVAPSLPKVMLRAFGWFILERHY